MNNKLTVNRLAFGNLRARKKQYTLMIIGIVLAMIFSSGVMFFLFCMDASIQELNDKKMGKQDIAVNNAQDFQELINVDSIGDKGFAYVLGYGFTDEKEEQMGVSIAKLDEKAEEISYIIPKEGRMPEKMGEIALESDALSRLGLYNAKIGDKITLKVKICDGKDYLPEAVEKTYTLVGRLWDKRNNIEYAYDDPSFYPAAVVSSEEEIELGGKENVICFMTLKNPSKDLSPFYDDARELGLYENGWITVSDRNVLITTSQRWSLSGESDIRLTMILMVVLSGVLMIASCCGIVNAFNTNLQERRRQIGMLRAVGATKRQIVKIFGREAFIIALLTTPLSLVISYLAVKTIIGAMGDDFVFIAEWWVLAVCGIFSVVCVMAAAFIPLFLAARVSPMQAIRNIELSRKMKNKKIKSQKSFDAPKLIAKRNLVFYRKKRAAVSLILIITIFVSCFGISIAKQETDSTMPVPGDYHIQSSGVRSHYFHTIKNAGGYTENDRNEISSHHNVYEVNGRKTASTNILTEEYSEYMDVLEYRSSTRFVYEENRYNKSIEDLHSRPETERYKNLRSQLGFSEHLFKTTLNGYEASEILKYMEGSEYKGEVNIDKLNSGEEVIIIAPERIGFAVNPVKGSSGAYSYTLVDMDRFEKGEYKTNRSISKESIVASATCEYKVGDTLKLSTLMSNELPEDDISMPDDTQRIDREVRIAAIVTLPISKGYFHENLSLYTTVQGFEKLAPGCNYWSFDIHLNEECTAEIDEEMTAFISSFNAGKENTYFHSYFKTNEGNKSATAGLYIAVFSISVLFFSICASVVNNSLTAQIREGKREIGTLRAVGASVRELTNSYFRQLLSMFGWGCGLGFGIYTFVYLAMLIYAKYLNSELIYSYEIWQAALICFVLLMICTLNLYFKIKKQMKNSIVENIREL